MAWERTGRTPSRAISLRNWSVAPTSTGAERQALGLPVNRATVSRRSSSMAAAARSRPRPVRTCMPIRRSGMGIHSMIRRHSFRSPLLRLETMAILRDGPYRVSTFSVGPYDNNVYLLTDVKGQEALLIDAANEAPRILKELDGLRVTTILTTHGHADHVQALT